VDGGIRIVALVPGGPASVAGLRPGDLLIEAGSVQLVDQDALGRVLEGHAWDRELKVVVLRNGEQRTFRVKPSHRAAAQLLPNLPTVPVAPVLWPGWGISPGLKTVSITAELRGHYGAPRDRGVLVVRVDQAGPCGRAGIEVGDVIVGVGKEPVSTPAEVDLALARRDRGVALSLEFVRNRETVVKDLAAEAPAAPTGSFRVFPDTQARAGQLERAIALTERRLETLRKQLAELKAVDKPATPDR
jgi:serine protease Do